MPRMLWLYGIILLFFSIGRTATGELFNFDLSPLRPGELCGPSGVTQHPDPDTFSTIVEYCTVQNHIQLFGADETIFKQRVGKIQKASANRAVSLYLEMRSTLVDASILAPVAKQIVQFIIHLNSANNLTSHFPAIGLSNLLDLRFWNCLHRLRINKADFSGLKNIRAIEFRGASAEFIQPGTFMNLHTLQTVALGNGLGNLHKDLLEGYTQLKCDAKNAWLWEFLKVKPGLFKSRPVGDIFTLGSFTSTLMKVEQPEVKCNGSEKAAIVKN